MHKNHQPLPRDGFGDGEQFRTIVTALVERGRTDIVAIKEDIAGPGTLRSPATGTRTRLQRRSSRRFLGDSLPGWFRERIESLTIPMDRDQYFRETVAALAAGGWYRWRITVEIAGRPWISQRATRPAAALWSGACNRCSWSSHPASRPTTSRRPIFARCNAP
jgi:hypothetical protein